MALRNWPLASVPANTVTDLVVPAASSAVAIVGLIVCNTDATDAADVTITLTDAAGTILSTVLLATLDPRESLHLDTRVVLAASATPEKLRVLATLAGVSVTASGSEG